MQTCDKIDTKVAMDSLQGLIAIAALVLGVVIVMSGDYEDEKQIDANYCQMVKLHKDSDGENGWPDYKGIYQDCK